MLAFVLGAGAAAGAGYLYLHSTPPAALPATPPAAVPATPPAATGKPARAPEAGGRPTQAEIPKRMPAAPFGTSEDVFEAGAGVYAARCASCHGTPAKDAAAKAGASQLWRAGRRASSAYQPGEIYTVISEGVPAKGMPAYASTLTDTQIWQLALLLKSADGDLPDPVMDLLNKRPGPSGASR